MKIHLGLLVLTGGGDISAIVYVTEKTYHVDFELKWRHMSTMASKTNAKIFYIKSLFMLTPG